VPPSLERAVDKRKNEFLAGRWCSREALRRCAPELAHCPIGIGTHSAPLWPVGIVGAITHTHGFASVAVARSAEARGIGLDAEVLIVNGIAMRIAHSIATKDELSAVMSAGDIGPELALTIVFSAKETLFKALYPHVGRYFDFSVARLEHIDPRDGCFQVRLLSDLTSEWIAGSVFDGNYEVKGGGFKDLVCTAMILR
jgi:enterobactin synthetase component D